MKNINQTAWEELISKDKTAIIIDARTPNEWNDGIIENAVLLDVLNEPKFLESAKTFDKEKNYYVYCRSGARSVKACQILESVGVEATYNLLGGILSWEGNTLIPEQRQ